MKTIIFFLLIAINLFAINCGDFKGEFATYNGHYYAVTGNKMSFETAKQFAQANGGYIAIPDNIGENGFIQGLVGTNNNAWIGIYDPNYTQTLCFTHNCYSTTRNRFKTIKNTALSFQNWDSTDIENQFIEGDDKVDIYNKPLISLLGEHWALMSGNTGKWRDWGTHFTSGENPAVEKAIIEFDTKPTCYNTPSTVTDNITGRVCNSQIWDSVVGLSNGATAQCLTDASNVEYCPQSLAQCGQSWDYETGYSVGAVGSVTDYTNKVTTSNTTYSASSTKLQTSFTYAVTSGGMSCNESSCYWNQYATLPWTDIPQFTLNLGSSNSFNFNGNNYPAVSSVNFRVSSGVLQASFTYAVTSGGMSCNESSCYWNQYATLPWTTVSQFTVSNDPIKSLNMNDAYLYPNGFNRSSYPDVSSVNYRVYNGKLQTSFTYAVTSGGMSCNESSCYWNQYATLPWTDIPQFTLASSLNGYPYGFNSSSYPDVSSVNYRVYEYCTNGTTPSNGQCATTTTTTQCPAGYQDNGSNCKTNQNYTYYNYICFTSGYSPINSGGNTGKTDPNSTVQNDLTSALNSATPPTNNCRKIRFTCLSNPSRPCANVNGQMQCSPFPCMGNSDFENAGTVEGENDKNNAGWQNDGNCAGQLYIFNGEDKRCRKDDKLFGLTGGGCCDKDKVFMGLVSCKENEKMLAKKRNNDLCHYVGSYCSKKLKLGFAKICIQNSESHCCFASKLGRIIHEQGRPQLGIDWGSGDSPNCRGFTPNEFQKLDFSKINFDEFAKDIQAKTTNFQNIGGFVQNKVQNFFKK